MKRVMIILMLFCVIACSKEEKVTKTGTLMVKGYNALHLNVWGDSLINLPIIPRLDSVIDVRYGVTLIPGTLNPVKGEDYLLASAGSISIILTPEKNWVQSQLIPNNPNESFTFRMSKILSHQSFRIQDMKLPVRIYVDQNVETSRVNTVLEYLYDRGLRNVAFVGSAVAEGVKLPSLPTHKDSSRSLALREIARKRSINSGSEVARSIRKNDKMIINEMQTVFNKIAAINNPVQKNIAFVKEAVKVASGLTNEPQKMGRILAIAHGLRIADGSLGNVRLAEIKNQGCSLKGKTLWKEEGSRWWASNSATIEINMKDLCQ